jgi:hypothetical protein
MFATTPFTPQTSVYLPTNHMSHQTPATAEGVIGSVPSPPVVANPKHHYFQSMGKECWLLRHYARTECTIWTKRIIWISRSYRRPAALPYVGDNK